MKNLLLFITLFILSSSLIAQKDTSKVEWIKVYFNSTSDHSFALPNNESNDLFDMIQPLIDRIDSAKFSIDLVAYDLQNMRVGHALANASRRGVRVRVITDIIHRNHAPRFTQPMWDSLRAAGIYNIDDSGTIYHPDGQIIELYESLPNSGANMHHKFAVFDLLNEDPEDDYLWTGTMNITYTGPWNTNATLLIKDSGLAGIYGEEFQQMWGSKTEIPNANKARFHKDKKNVSQNIHFVNNTKVEAYFGPLDRDNRKPSISNRITELINDYARHDVHFLAFAISPNIPISEALIDRSGRGEINLQGIIDPAFYARYRNNDQIWAKPEMNFGNRKIMSGREVRKLHSKTMIIDTQYPYPEKHKSITIVGSYNFSAAAEIANDENILMIYDNKIANQFLQDFKGVLSRAEGKTYHHYPAIDTSVWYENYRFGRNGNIEIELETNIFYPVELLGVKIPRSWAGHKDSSYFYSEESNSYLAELIDGAKLKVSSGNEIPSHRFSRYTAYIKAKTDSGIIDVNRNMLASGHASYSSYDRQPMDSIMSFKVAELKAKDNKFGMWAFPELFETKVLTPDAKKMIDLFPLDLNLATVEELTFIPSIGSKTAEIIIEYRNKHKGFNRLEELTRIPGIGEATLEKLRPFLFVELE
ncbi:phospholipase D-like domain-containing protein [Brumimicrobium mesophilum]|uniref:phospholipase D-like domain-containing protein n=1 Tax=Brumimicrobium mesophilum TaxID=392717 RepID=UPI000D144BA8|nr:phospholipase D-like domain-containing protein [Brumimicrobium mesophilum]